MNFLVSKRLVYNNNKTKRKCFKIKIPLDLTKSLNLILANHNMDTIIFKINLKDSKQSIETNKVCISHHHMK